MTPSLSALIICTIAVSLSADVQTLQVEERTAVCRQLGCDLPGNFKQDSFKVPSSQPKQVWRSKHATILPMRPENENYGCLASEKLVVCPIKDKIELPVRYTLLNPDTGEEIETDGYDIQTNISMPILTSQDLVFSVNQSHVSLVNPWMKKSVTEKLPQPFNLGVHSPLYLPELDFYLVVGNFSDRFYIYQVDESANEISLLTEFSVNKTKSHCGYMAVSEVVVDGSRIYYYGYHVSDAEGVIAVDLMKTAPYYKKAWDLTDDDDFSINMFSRSSMERSPETSECIDVPDVDSDYAWFPPTDLQIQMLATPDGYIVTTSAVEMMVIKDLGDSGDAVSGSLFGSHFLSLDYRPETNFTPVVWMTGWQLYPPFRVGLIGYNYTDTNSTDNPVWNLVLPGVTDTSGDANITSRITSFPDPQHKDKRIMVFGASLETKNRSDWLHEHYLPDREPGIHKVVMAIRTQYNFTEHPDIVWITPIETVSNEFEVKGQIVGVLDKLIMYVSSGKLGYIMAIK